MSGQFPEDSIPFDKAIQTVKDVDLAVIGIYDAFKSSALYSGNLTLLPDLQTDFVYGVNGNTNVYGDIWRWKNILATNTDIEAVYGSLYMVINRCNFLLDRVDNVRKNVTNDEQLDKLDQCCGEAYFARALAYSELVKLFCKAYESDEDAAQQLGVILTCHYGGNEKMKRASLKDSYDFILEDLDRAEELLKIEEDYPGNLYDDNHSPYFNEYTVHALRARVSLYMKNWDDAIKYSTKVIESNRYRSVELHQCDYKRCEPLQIYVDQRFLNRDHLASRIHRHLLWWCLRTYLCQLRLCEPPPGLRACRMGYQPI